MEEPAAVDGTKEHKLIGNERTVRSCHQRKNIVGTVDRWTEKMMDGLIDRQILFSFYWAALKKKS